MVLPPPGKSTQRLFFVAAAIFCIASAIAGCEKQLAKKSGGEEGRQSAAAPPSDHAGKFAPGDLLDVRCMDLMAPGVESSTPTRLGSDGAASLPYVGKVKLTGLTHGEAERAIAKAYKDANLVENLQVYIRRLMVAGGDQHPSGIIGNFDLVRISISGVVAPGTETIRVMRVDPDGTVGLPYISRCKITGLTEEQAAAGISEAYQSTNDLTSTPVTVLILESAPPDAATRDLPDGPIRPYEPIMAPLFEPSTPELPPTIQSATPGK